MVGLTLESRGTDLEKPLPQQILQRSAQRQRQEVHMKEVREAELEAQLAKAKLEARELSEQLLARDVALRNQTSEINELKELVRR